MRDTHKYIHRTIDEDRNFDSLIKSFYSTTLISTDYNINQIHRNYQFFCYIQKIIFDKSEFTCCICYYLEFHYEKLWFLISQNIIRCNIINCDTFYKVNRIIMSRYACVKSIYNFIRASKHNTWYNSTWSKAFGFEQNRIARVAREPSCIFMNK